MEILQFLLYFLLEEYGGKDLAPLLETFKENDFDIKKSLKTLSPKDLIPAVKLLIEKFGQKKHPDKTECFEKLKPISSFAPKLYMQMLCDFYEKIA